MLIIERRKVEWEVFRRMDRQDKTDYICLLPIHMHRYMQSKYMYHTYPEVESDKQGRTFGTGDRSREVPPRRAMWEEEEGKDIWDLTCHMLSSSVAKCG
jgi:hypothetical protein